MKLDKKKEELYVKSIKEFFISSVEHLQKAKLKKMLDQTRLDHIHWLFTTAQGRKELKRRREATAEKQHQAYISDTARNINAFENSRRIKLGLPIRKFRE